MEAFVVVQKLLAWGPAYEISASGSNETAYAVKGKVMTLSPKLSLHQGSVDGPALAFLEGNFLKTKFDCLDAERKPIAHLSFPALQFKKRFTISCGGRDWQVDGGIVSWEFRCVGSNNEPAFTIAKQPSLLDKFSIEHQGELPREVVLLTAVAIDQKYFQEAA